MSDLRCSTNPYAIEQEARIRLHEKEIGIVEARELLDTMVHWPCFKELPRPIRMGIKRLSGLIEGMEQ